MRDDAGRASCAFTPASKEISQGIARISGRETASMVSIGCPYKNTHPKRAFTNPDAAKPFPEKRQRKSRQM
jgi:hypothetical protein